MIRAISCFQRREEDFADWDKKTNSFPILEIGNMRINNAINKEGVVYFTFSELTIFCSKP